MNRRDILRISAFALGASLSRKVFADGGNSIHLGTGINITFGQVIENLISFLAVSITAVCTTLFILGAFFLVVSRGKEDQIKRGKDLMFRSIEGLVVVLGSYAILRTVIWMLYQ